jgi:uncharacterized protein
LAQLGPVELLIIQGSPFCNIDCKYCYLPNRRQTDKITFATVKRAIDNVIEENLVHERFSIVWHAGEPLAMPIDFYRQVSEYIDELASDQLTITQFIQTNAMLINQDWCDLFIKHKINVGVSIDGPEELHNANRVTRGGRGTFSKVMKGIQLLKKNEINFSAIAVVTADALKYPKEIFEFFVSLKPKSLGLNIDEQVGDNQTTSINTAIIESVKNFWRALYEINLDSKEHLHIREIFHFNELLLNPFFDKRPPMAGQMLGPLKIINMDIKGDFTTFSPELIDMKDDNYGDFKLGNVHSDSFRGIVNNEKFKRMYREIAQGVRKCQASCDFFDVCGGGSPSNKYYENGTFDSTETQFCLASRKAIAEEILSVNERLYLEK